MYEEYWGLKEKPFENTPDPRFIFHSTQHEEVLSRLLYIVKEGKGAAMLTGIFGCGKTLIGRTLLRQLEEDVYRVAFITNPYLSYEELLMHILHKLGGENLPVSKAEIFINVILEKMNDILINNMRDGKKTVIIIDEAHVIKDKKVWEEIRLILNFQLEDRFLLTLLLLGQPELKTIIDANKEFAQRIAVKSHLGSLTEEEVKKYIQHRLSIAGRKEPVFQEDAYKEIFMKSGGIPRRVNHICDFALLSGSGEGATLIGKDLIKEVSSDIEG
jgi:general secretion pathway protein A